MADDTSNVLNDFAALLAGGDENERNAWIARAKMLAMQGADPSVFEPPVRTLGEYLDTPIEIPPVLVEPALLVRGAILCTVGRAGKGKTQVNLNRIMKWSVGRDMFDGLTTFDDEPLLKPSGPLRVLIIENEGAAGMFHKQVGIMLNAEGYLVPEERKLARDNILVWGDGGWSGLKLDDEAKLNEVRAACEVHKPDVLFIEPFRGLWKGEENSSTDMAIVADALSSVASEYNLGVILTHHERKSGAGEDGEKMSAGRGSTVLEGVVATMENFEVAKGGDYRELSWSKVRYGGGHAMLPVRMQWQHSAWWYDHVPFARTEQEILGCLMESDPEPMTIREIADVTDEKIHTIRRVLKQLENKEPAKVVRRGSAGEGAGMRFGLPSTSGENPGGGEKLMF